MKKIIHFLMVITPYQLKITNYCVKSYNKVYEALKDKYEIKLILYLNGFNKRESYNVLNRWSQLSFVDLIYGLDASEFVAKEQGGYEYNSRINSYPLERHGEVIDKFFVSSKCDYFVTIDDDFEIFNPEFVKLMFDALETQIDIPIISSDFNETHRYYDKNSKDWIILQRRNTAWFCIYRKSDILPISHEVVDRFKNNDDNYIVYDFQNGNWEKYIKNCRQCNSIREVFDTSGYCQEQIREKKSTPLFSLTDLAGDFSGMYIHYGAGTTKIRTYFFLYRGLIRCSLSGNKISIKIFRKVIKLIYA